MNTLAEKYMVEYYANDAKKLRGVVDRILARFGGIDDVTEFYSLADEVFFDVMRRYDNESSFEGFLYTCLDRKIKTEITRRNRDKRTQYVRDKEGRKVKDEDGKPIIIQLLYLDTPVGDEETTFGDLLPVKEEKDNPYTEIILCYMKKLSRKQRQIAEYLESGYHPYEIRREMGISEARYKMLFTDMCSESKTRYLRQAWKGAAI
ncbi:MAG: hypothetical protein LUD12_12235 [Lachnospiraceae bacterium]|nr:hypothetical protein [Lachnospiraceae bacterium]